MKEIIEPGKKSFVLTCSHCGCKFRYELEDIGCGNEVYCPDCHNMCFHPRQEESNYFDDYPLDYSKMPWLFEYRSNSKDPLPDLGITINYCEDK